MAQPQPNGTHAFVLVIGGKCQGVNIGPFETKEQAMNFAGEHSFYNYDLFPIVTPELVASDSHVLEALGLVDLLTKED